MEETEVEERTHERSLRDVYYVLFRHKWKMVLFLVTVIGTVTVGTLRRPDIFRSEAKLLLRLGRESVTLDPTVTTGQIIGVSRSRESEINSELEILKSRVLAGKVVDTIGPLAFLKRPDEILKEDTSSGSDVAKNATGKTRDVRTAVERLRNPLEQLSQAKRLSDRHKADQHGCQNREEEQ